MDLFSLLFSFSLEDQESAQPVSDAGVGKTTCLSPMPSLPTPPYPIMPLPPLPRQIEPLAPCDPSNPSKPAPFVFITENVYLTEPYEAP